MLRIQLVSGLVWTLHYILLGALSGAGFNFMTSVRNYLFVRYRKQTWLFWVVIVAYFFTVLVTWKNWTSIFPLVASIVSTIAFWQKNPRHIRFLGLLVPPFWFTYNLLNGSYPGMLGDMITLSSILVGIYRFDVLPVYRKRISSRNRA